jgi:hypothetical protein
MASPRQQLTEEQRGMTEVVTATGAGLVGLKAAVDVVKGFKKPKK